MWRDRAIETILSVHNALDIYRWLKIPAVEVKLKEFVFLSRSLMGEMLVSKEGSVLEHLVPTVHISHLSSSGVIRGQVADIG